MKILVVLSLGLLTNVALAGNCCVKVPNGAQSGTCTLKAMQGNPLTCAGGFNEITVPAGVCPEQGAQPKSTTCSTVQPASSVQAIAIRIFDKSWYISNP